jgi:hypothetical protein
MTSKRPRRRKAFLLLVVLVVFAVAGSALWYFTNRPEPRSAERLCERLSGAASLSQSIATLDPTTLGPQVAELQRAVDAAPSDIEPQLNVLSKFVQEVADVVRASPTDKKEALTAALADRQSRVDEVSTAGQAVEAWSIANCGTPLRSTTTARN